MTKKQADNKAKEMFGQTSFAIRTSHKDRNQRFGIMIIDKEVLLCLGYGDSFEAALNMAAKLKEK